MEASMIPIDMALLDRSQRNRFGVALALRRIALVVFLLVWGLVKFIISSRNEITRTAHRAASRSRSSVLITLPVLFLGRASTRR